MSLLSLPVIRAVADAHEATPAQVSLAYLMKLGCSAVPKTSNPQRLVENLGAVDLELSDDDVAALDGVIGERLSGDPLTFPG